MSTPATNHDPVLAGLLDALPDAIIAWDLEGKVALRSGGASDLDPAVEKALDSAALAARSGEVTDEVVECSQENARAFSIRVMPSPAEGFSAVAIASDASELQLLRQIRSEFVADVSHELKTPVGAISLLSEQLLSDNDTETAVRFSQRIYDEARRLSRLIEDLIDLSELEGAASDESKRRVSIAGVIADAMSGRQSMAEHANIHIEFEGSPGGMTVLGDQRLLVSALKNLLENAIKYSDPGSTVTISTRQEGDHVLLTVSDEGIGIPEEHIQLIFHRFHRVDRARARGTGGSGLGLSIVRHIAKTHGGSVEVESEEGKGSAFTIRLPLNEVST